MDLRNVKDLSSAAPPGRYTLKCTASEATQAKSSGAPMITLSWEIRDGDHAGATIFENIITDGNYKGASFGKKKMQELGIDTNQAIPDEVLVEHFLGMEVVADIGIEQRRDKEQKLVWGVDRQTGKQIPVYNNKVIQYVNPMNVPAVASAPQGMSMAQPTPQAQPMPLVQQAPVQMPPQYQQPQMQMQMAQGQPMAQPTAQPMAQPTAQPQYAPPPWQQPQAAQPMQVQMGGGNGAQAAAQVPPAQATGRGKGRSRVNIQDV